MCVYSRNAIFAEELSTLASNKQVVTKMASSIKAMWILNSRELNSTLTESLAEQIPYLDEEYYYQLLGKLSDEPELCRTVEFFRTPPKEPTSPYGPWFYGAILVGVINLILAMSGQFDDMDFLPAAALGFSILWLPMIVGGLDTRWKQKNGLM